MARERTGGGEREGEIERDRYIYIYREREEWGENVDADPTTDRTEEIAK